MSSLPNESGEQTTAKAQIMSTARLIADFINTIDPNRTFGVNVTKEKPRDIARGFVIDAVS